MQFLSQSLGWADNIILAMAPLGIITIIVAASESAARRGLNPSSEEQGKAVPSSSPS